MSSNKGLGIVISIVVFCFVLIVFTLIFALNVPASNLYNSSSHSESEYQSNNFISTSSLTSSNSSNASVSTIDPLGNIVKAFLSPYTANTNYKNIYLNNRTDYDIDLKKIYNSVPDIKIIKSDKPEVLILHTHATEGYITKGKDKYNQKDIEQTREESRSVIRVGEIVSEKLKEYGISCIHDKTLHDDPSYTNSYNRSSETATKYLEKYPSIKIILDIHRDSVSAENGLVRCVSQQNGRDAAQIMFVTGSQTGNVTGFDNWEENLKLVLRLQEISETLYPGFARSIYFTSKKYNQHLSTGSLLIEVGSSVNTIDEAEYAAQLLGQILGIGLNMYAEKK